MDIKHSVNRNAWLPCLLAAFFAAYVFFQMDSINALNLPLSSAMYLSQKQIGVLASLYLYSDAIFLIPAGILLDKLPIRWVVLSAISMVCLGVLLFFTSTSYLEFCIARIIMAMGHACALLACFRLISSNIALKNRGFFVGVTLAIALAGGGVAQAPFNLLIHQLGWRDAMLVNFLFGVFLAISFFCFSTNLQQVKCYKDAVNSQGVIAKTKEALLSRQNWFSALFIIFQSTPLLLFGAAWGIPYLISLHHFTSLQASVVTMMVFVGMIVGSPILGYFSDVAQARLPILKSASVVSILLVLAAKFIFSGFFFISLLFFLIGFCASSQSLSYLMISENSPNASSSFFMSFSNVVIMLGCATIQFFSGQLFSQSKESFEFLIYVLLLGLVLALLVSVLSKETYRVE